jgi:excinuclease ABC subunit C
VDCLFSCQLFENFGPSRLGPPLLPSCHRITATGTAQLRRLLRRDCPRVPGVYGMVNARGHLVYVGKAKCLRARLLSYFRPRSRDPKAGRILAQTQTIHWERASDEFGALLRELELIQHWRPRLNIRGQPARQRLAYICLGRSPAPYLYVSRTLPVSGASCYGPVRAGRRAREAVRHLSDCPKNQVMVFSEQGELFPQVHSAGCLRFEMGVCLGPCLAACSKEAYLRQARAARAFLEGRNTALLRVLEQRMTSASESFEFEKAASLRDKLELLRWLHDRVARLRAACGHPPFVYPVGGRDGTETWYVINRGMVVGVFRPPSTRGEKEIIMRAIQDTITNKTRSSARMPAHAMDGVHLVADWFRRHPEERRRIRRIGN